MTAAHLELSLLRWSSDEYTLEAHFQPSARRPN